MRNNVEDYISFGNGMETMVHVYSIIVSTCESIFIRIYRSDSEVSLSFGVFT